MKCECPEVSKLKYLYYIIFSSFVAICRYYFWFLLAFKYGTVRFRSDDSDRSIWYNAREIVYKFQISISWSTKYSLQKYTVVVKSIERDHKQGPQFVYNYHTAMPCINPRLLCISTGDYSFILPFGELSSKSTITVFGTRLSRINSPWNVTETPFAKSRPLRLHSRTKYLS